MAGTQISQPELLLQFRFFPFGVLKIPIDTFFNIFYCIRGTMTPQEVMG